jgi:hypothetical protein
MRSSQARLTWGAGLAVLPLLVFGTTPVSSAQQADRADRRVAERSAPSLRTGEPALQLAQAMAVTPSVVTGAQMVTTPSGAARMASSQGVGGFPTHGGSFAALSSGDAGLVYAANDAPSTSTNFGGGNVRGDTDFDVSVLRVDLEVPAGANCLSLDFKFLSEEYPEFVGQTYNDAFVAELDQSTWSTSGSEISAPDNFAFDPVGNVISINAAGVTSMTAGQAGGTTYDGATPRLRASTEIDEGPHSLYLSLFDQGDWVYDSTVLLDRLVLGAVEEGTCVEGAQPPPGGECTIKGTAGKDRLEGTEGDDVICGYGKEDVLIGNGGNDVLRGGAGEDDLIGGPGDDELYGGLDDDALRGDEGFDLLDGQEGKDLVTFFTATGGATIDLAARTGTAPGHDTDTFANVEGAFGTKFDDTILGDSGSNHLFGGPGNDTVNGRGGSDLVRGTAGADSVLGGPGGDLLFGDAGSDTLNGGGDKDGCYGGGGGGARVGCEVGNDQPDAGRATHGRSSVVPEAGPAVDGLGAPAFRAGGATYWYLGNDDYLFVYSRAATQSIGAWTGTPSWEGGVCRIVRYSPARGACSAASALQAVNKAQMRWFLWNAKRNGGCAIGIFDYGRHGVNQLEKRWKTRGATYYNYNVAIPWVTPGRKSFIKVSDRKEVGRDFVTVTC